MSIGRNPESYLVFSVANLYFDPEDTLSEFISGQEFAYKPFVVTG